MEEKVNSLTNVLMYTDGACSGNPGAGGWGVYLIYNDLEKELQGFESNTTNNRMELTAVIKGLKSLQSKSMVKVYTDSVYVKSGITSWIKAWLKANWKNSRNEEVKNIDLWKDLLHESSLHIVEWFWVKGHSANRGNDIADRLATEALKNGKNSR